MLKFAFIINMPGQNPDTYCGKYENAESCSIIAGTDGIDETKKLVKKLVADDFTLFNLCGDFDDAMTAQIRAVTGGDVKIVHSDYSSEEMKKMEKLSSLSEYGIIVKMDGVEHPEQVDIKCDDCNTHAVFVKDMPQAENAAKKLRADGVDFIELCSWFDGERTEAVINAVDGNIPVGTCGEL